MQVLQTSRLVLRWFTGDDAAFIYALLNDPGWIRFIGDKGVNSLETARAYIALALQASYRQHGFGLYAMQLKADAALVGMCGLVKRESLSDVDLGVALLERHAGRGLAYEAAAATLVHAREQFGLARIVAITDPENLRSKQLLTRLGMCYERTLHLDPGDHVDLYGRALQ